MKIQIRDTRNGEWFWANRLVLEHPYLTPEAKLTYLSLAYFANNKTQLSYPSISKIMELTQIKSRTTIVKAVRQLEKYYFIKTNKKIGKVTKYTLLKIVDSIPVHEIDQSIRDTNQSTRDTTPVHQGYTNKTNITRHINNKGLKDFKTAKEVLSLKGQ